MDERTARRLWHLVEPVHSVTYFTEESRAAADAAGMRGFWMGYFGMRSAPLGAVGPAVVTSCYYVFHRDRVARALPDAWSHAGPERLLAARLAGAGAALRRLCGDALIDSPDTALAADLAWQAAAAADTRGRVLGAANQALDRPDEPHLALWQAATTLREHRGDGHVAALVSHGIGPVQAQLLKVAAGESDGELLRTGRQWDDEAWQAATEDLRAQGWLDGDGHLTAAGRAAHEEVERLTDAAALSPWRALGERDTERLAGLLAPLARAASGVIPPGNPVGLTATAGR
ncbi:SCO6745 family protein [Prauserella muralis]|uniref:Uncharacterized protein n=1 Tax=Prauserella muralis TaxID=588067 RepID=A0A2V4B985_9PSEU|nr:hypothetical protein [Prauserella muralis]PXY31924.1 hypothetical protein BAY60_06245 [Prauserella muralis]TWE13653.1 hypothetical protein FHX69_5778 [Prauserella muralis]